MPAVQEARERVRSAIRNAGFEFPLRRITPGVGIRIPDALGEVGTVAADDILDAAVAAWSAGRIAAGEAVSLPSPPELDDGRPIAIWY